MPDSLHLHLRQDPLIPANLCPSCRSSYISSSLSIYLLPSPLPSTALRQSRLLFSNLPLSSSFDLHLQRSLLRLAYDLRHQRSFVDRPLISTIIALIDSWCFPFFVIHDLIKKNRERERRLLLPSLSLSSPFPQPTSPSSALPSSPSTLIAASLLPLPHYPAAVQPTPVPGSVPHPLVLSDRDAALLRLGRHRPQGPGLPLELRRRLHPLRLQQLPDSTLAATSSVAASLAQSPYAHRHLSGVRRPSRLLSSLASIPLSPARMPHMPSSAYPRSRSTRSPLATPARSPSSSTSSRLMARGGRRTPPWRSSCCALPGRTRPEPSPFDAVPSPLPPPSSPE